ncbi:hypothetical protein IFM89_032882 [Coptis chinensis]|uniref:Uncharacterized protein n=1 Tax=Coptis chinensis TaxID=261450 RepID=A0A835MAQ6_9MAGN|nr:hypothetical protein IFM89_032882 [Coptis chinensis]
MSLKCSGLYLAQFRLTSPHLLAAGDGSKSATTVGDVYPSAKVHPSAKPRKPPRGIFKSMPVGFELASSQPVLLTGLVYIN